MLRGSNIVSVFVFRLFVISNASVIKWSSGNRETSIEERPYMASLQYHHNGTDVKHTCGASIISTKFLLTAAHCEPLDDQSLDFLWARVGSSEYNSNGTLYKVQMFKSHPEYSSANADYDIALIGFSPGVEIILNSKIAIISLYYEHDLQKGSLATISGWRSTSEFEPEMNQLQEVSLPVIDWNLCLETYDWLTENQICLSGTDSGNMGPCYGESGGPVVHDGTQFAVVSGGGSCEEANVPSIYAKISSVRDWIRRQSGV